MQSEPTTLSPSTSNNGGHGISRAQDEDGFRHEDGAVALSPIGGPETVSTPARAAIQPPAAATLAAFTQTQVETPVPEDNGLRARKIPSPPAGRDRITDYEQAATPPIKKREGPGFEVIRKYRSPSDKTSPIQALPSGKGEHAPDSRDPAEIMYRGPDACTGTSVTNGFDVRCGCVKALPRLSHRPPCMAKRICALLSRFRLVRQIVQGRRCRCSGCRPI